MSHHKKPHHDKNKQNHNPSGQGWNHNGQPHQADAEKVQGKQYFRSNPSQEKNKCCGNCGNNCQCNKKEGQSQEKHWQSKDQNQKDQWHSKGQDQNGQWHSKEQNPKDKWHPKGK